ncbi:unnamed protein product [Orchesella dallaii]|uniref:Uncharacterized protein n=1 Tax=Orchesella dallaii TaxID=48710 RepID=A0ABP1PYQ6_9HEXA
MSDLSSINAELGLETEKQLWEIIKYIPGINVTYGTVRCIVYVVKKDDREATDSAIVAAKGAIQTAAITAGILTAPVTIPLAAGVLTGIVAKSVTETTEIIVFFVTNAENFQGNSKDQRGKNFLRQDQECSRNRSIVLCCPSTRVPLQEG